jgi:hypothetical protein
MQRSAPAGTLNPRQRLTRRGPEVGTAQLLGSFEAKGGNHQSERRAGTSSGEEQETER